MGNSIVTQKPVLWRLRPSERRIILLMGDISVSVLALFLAVIIWSRRDMWLDFSLEFLRQRIPGWFYFLPLVWLFFIIELYDIRRASHWYQTVRGVGIAAGISIGIYLLWFFLAKQGTLPRLGVGVFILGALIGTLLWRFLYIKIFTAPLMMRRVLIVGAGRAGSTLAASIRQIWPPPFHLIGFIDDDPEKIGTQVGEFPVLGGNQDLMKIIQAQNISDLIFAISGQMNPDMFQVLIAAEEQGIEVTTMPVVYEELLGRVPIFLLQSDWILRSFVDQAHTGEFYEVAKRTMDILGGLAGCLVLICLFPIISLAILLDDGYPIFYYQTRLGKSGQIYKIAKFRTMRNDAEIDGKARLATENDERVIRVGRLLRKSHLDELPQFFNVLRGDMSLVGPRAERPELVDELQTKVPFYRARLLVKPGLTGWAQVNFPIVSTIHDIGVKLEYDLYYIKHRNLMLDFISLIRTIGIVVRMRGVG